MGRWRPPATRSSVYITAEGEKALTAELRELWQLRRREVVPAITAAAAEGDRSENAEYIYRKKQLAEIDRRIRYLSRRLDEVEVVDRIPQRTDRIFFGAYVTIEDLSGGESRFRIVGADEIDPARGYISVDSPMARAMLGKSDGEEFQVNLPGGLREFTIVCVEYEKKKTGRAP